MRLGRHHHPRSTLIRRALLGLAAAWWLTAAACSQPAANNNSNASSENLIINTNLPANRNLNTIDLSNLNRPPDDVNLAPASAVVSITNSGFTPEVVTVRISGTVTWKNSDAAEHWPAADPHPAHTNLPDLDSLTGLAPGKSYSFTFPKAGTFTYHDHLQPLRRGTVIVK